MTDIRYDEIESANLQRGAVDAEKLRREAGMVNERRGQSEEIDDIDTWWLLERKALAPEDAPGQHPIWWTGEDGPYPWTTDANRARKFATRELAEAAIAERSGIFGVHTPFAVATEHIWLSRVGKEDWEYVGYEQRSGGGEGAAR